MHHANIEHINVSVSNAQHTAVELCKIFDWHIRWSGKNYQDRDVFHIGTKASYIAIVAKPPDNERSTSELNHIGIVVDDLEAIENRVLAAGYKTHSHGDYEPGRRFYYHDHNGIEYEIVSYAKAALSFKQAFIKQLGAIAKSACLYK
ncbi:MAG: VOC family protein [Maricaulaceae bacterium]